MPLTRPLTQPLTRALSAAGAGFNPASLFRSGELGFVYDHSRIDSFFQDSARTTPASVGDPVGAVLDRGPNGLHRTASGASRPILRQSGSLYYLEYDGSDDFMLTAAVNLTVGNKFTICSGARKTADIALSSLIQLPSVAAVEISFPRSAVLTGPCLTVGAVDLRGAAVAAPTTAVLTAELDGAGATDADKMKLRRNGAATGAFAGSGATISFTNNPIYFGRRGGTVAPFTGFDYGGVGINRVLSPTERDQLEAWVGVRCGVFF